MKIKLMFTSAIVASSIFANAQNPLDLNQKTQQFFNKPWEVKPKIEIHKFSNQLKNIYVLKAKGDNMPVLLCDSAATEYFKPHIFLFNQTPATVYYMPNALKKTLLFDPKPSTKALLNN